MNVDLFIEYNFAPIIGLIFQLVILMYGKTFNKREKIIFYLALVLQAFELLAYNLEFYFSSLDKPTTWRILFSVIGYIVRPALVYPFIFLLRNGSNKFSSKLFYLDLIPLVLVVIIQQFAFFTKWVFYFDESNSFHRGPLGYISQIVTILYMVEAAVQVVLTKVLNRKFNVGLIIVLLAYVVFAMIFESIFSIRSLGISAGVFSIVFFMFSLQTNYLNDLSYKLKITSEVDALSQISNRYSGEKQIDSLVSKRTSGVFIVLDIDKFKYINDTYGHAIGDEAIIKVAAALRKSFGDEDVVMRLGGDEFAIYSTRTVDEIKEKEIISNLFKQIDDIRLSCDNDFRIHISAGVVQYDGEEETSFDTLYRLADVKLYKAKKIEGNHACD